MNGRYAVWMLGAVLPAMGCAPAETQGRAVESLQSSPNSTKAAGALLEPLLPFGEGAYSLRQAVDDAAPAGASTVPDDRPIVGYLKVDGAGKQTWWLEECAGPVSSEGTSRCYVWPDKARHPHVATRFTWVEPATIAAEPFASTLHIHGDLTSRAGPDPGPGTPMPGTQIEPGDWLIFGVSGSILVSLHVNIVFTGVLAAAPMPVAPRNGMRAAPGATQAAPHSVGDQRTEEWRLIEGYVQPSSAHRDVTLTFSPAMEEPRVAHVSTGTYQTAVTALTASSTPAAPTLKQREQNAIDPATPIQKEKKLQP